MKAILLFLLLLAPACVRHEPPAYVSKLKPGEMVCDPVHPDHCCIGSEPGQKEACGYLVGEGHVGKLNPGESFSVDIHLR